MNRITKLHDELLDLVNDNDQVIGQELRSVIRATNQLHRIRAVWLFLKNKEGKLWIPRRAATKKSHPLALDGSVVGAVSAGETYEQALEREAFEEIGMQIAGNYSYV
jgi:isopentenyldiphosphate isomerase